MLKDKIIIILLLCFMLAGCGQMVSGPKPTAGNTLELKINFREKFDTTEYRFYFIYSLKPISYELYHYCFIPGEKGGVNDVYSIDEQTTLPGSLSTNVNEVIEFYYAQYFSSWSDVVQFSDILPAPQIVKASGSYFPVSSNTTIHDGYNLSAPNTYLFQPDTSYSNGFTFQIDLSELSNAPSIGDTIYVQFLTLDKERNVVDVLSDTAATIVNQLYIYFPEQYDESDETISGNIDITEWRLNIL